MIFTLLSGFSQSVVNTAFQSGEILTMKGSYFMSPLWADIAEIKIEVSDFVTEGRSLYSIKATGSTYSNYDSFFKIRDLYQSWVEKDNIKPFMFVRNVDEGGYKFNMKYVIRRSSLQARLEYKRNDITRETIIPITENTQDLVSVIYYVRTLDFEKMPVNKVITVPTLIDEKVENIILTYKGKENIKSDVFGTISCYRLAVSANNKAIVNKETNNIWLTANKNKIPVMAKAEIPVGSIQLRLVSAQGIKK
ncbi:MAG: DUF3108 domain-containing protein [Bacteroidota bacterium]